MKNPHAPMGVPKFEYQNRMITTTWPAESNSASTLMEIPIAEQGGRKILKYGFKLILCNGHYHSRVTSHLQAYGWHEWTDRPLRITQAIYKDSQAIQRAEAISLSLVTNTLTAILYIERSSLSATEAVLKYFRTFVA